MNSFTEFSPCKHRFACVQCRNDPKFIESMEKRFGKWECPEGITIGTPLEKMPEQIRNKIESYQKRIEEKGKKEIELNNRQTKSKEEREVQSRSRINDRSNLIQNTDFTKLPMCKQRAVCYECRNNTQFRERMERVYGKWECPEGILIGTPTENMPVNVQNIERTKKDKARKSKEMVLKIKQDVLDIEKIIPPQVSEKFERIKYYLFPEMKDPKDCIHKGDPKQVKQSCCGGKIKMVDGFYCKIKGEATKRICRTCSEFKKGIK